MSERTGPAWTRRVLGPSGPEASCEECFERLDRYVELELGDEDAARWMPGLHAHLEGCPACAEDHDSLLALAREERDAGR